jgi:beta-lactamase superfamily II metal-dependent hydrolase
VAKTSAAKKTSRKAAPKVARKTRAPAKSASAGRKSAKKALPKAAPDKAPAGRRPVRKAPPKTAADAAPAGRKSARKVPPKTAPSPAPTPAPAGAQPAAAADGNANIRVRMYRVGFGDFFLLTVPGKHGPAHILVDCGVHAKNIGTMNDCVQDMKRETGNRLALVILTHNHADHMSGFATNFDDFANIEVGAVWITNRLDPKNADASKFMAQLTSVAQQLKSRLAADSNLADEETHRKVENALGVANEDGGSGSNAKALRLLQSGFRNKPPVFYYQGGDTPTLPDELEGMITAEILAPSPKDSGGDFSAADNKTEQYLAALGDDGVPDPEAPQPFDPAKWPAAARDYPKTTFDEFDGLDSIEKILAGMQPNALAAAADKLDGTLNNQSLVVLFTCNGKKLLFVGDAQWGNWAYWLYGKTVTGSDPGISARAKEILGSIDFYKVGHHGSTNATPVPAVDALNQLCACMCSTAMGAYGKPDKKTEVPRTRLMDALETRIGKRLVRSDWVQANDAKAEPQAREEAGDELPAGFSTPGNLYIDFNL